MQVIVAGAAGICFGVRDAIEAAERFADPRGVTILGDLVHNPAVTARMEALGFSRAPAGTAAALLPSETVLITAHGLSDRARFRLEAAGKRILDTTCPLVRRAHEAARRLESEGFHVLVIGTIGHAEVEGIVGDLESFHVVEREEDVETYPFPRLGVVCQTTTTVSDAERLLEAIARKNPGAEVRHVDTICQPTKDRQQALERLLGEVDAVVVVGGSRSNNTRKLVERCVARGVPAFHVEGKADLRPEWFRGCRVVGLTAGTSTLPETIEDVHREICRLEPES